MVQFACYVLVDPDGRQYKFNLMVLVTFVFLCVPPLSGALRNRGRRRVLQTRSLTPSLGPSLEFRGILQRGEFRGSGPPAARFRLDPSLSLSSTAPCFLFSTSVCTIPRVYVNYNSRITWRRSPDVLISLRARDHYFFKSLEAGESFRLWHIVTASFEGCRSEGCSKRLVISGTN